MPNSDIKIYNFELKKKCSASSCSSRSHSLVRLEGFMGFICEWFSLRFPAEQQPLREQSIVLITPAKKIVMKNSFFVQYSCMDWMPKRGNRVLEEISNYFRSVVLRDGFALQIVNQVFAKLLHAFKTFPQKKKRIERNEKSNNSLPFHSHVPQRVSDRLFLFFMKRTLRSALLLINIIIFTAFDVYRACYERSDLIRPSTLSRQSCFSHSGRSAFSI